MSQLQFSSHKQRVDTYIGNKTAFYDFMIRKRFFMPEEKSNCNTVDFMDRVWR